MGQKLLSEHRAVRRNLVTLAVRQGPFSQMCCSRGVSMANRLSQSSHVPRSPGAKRDSLSPQPSSLSLTALYKRVMILACCLLIQGQCCAAGVTLNCSRPDAESLLEAVETVLNKSTIRPVLNLKTPTNVNISFTVYGIIGVNEKEQLLMTFIWQVLEWDIEYLSWDPIQCGAERVSLARTLLWVPDILINEFMDENKSPEAPYVYVDHTGHVYDDKPVRAITSCNLNIYYFPFDVQNCSFTFGSYLHFATDVTVSQGTSAKDILQESRDVIQTTGEWELVNIQANHFLLQIQNKDYEEIVYYLVLRRRPTVYIVNLLIPSCFLITVDLFSFLLPPQSVDRSTFKMTLILGYTVFLLIMNDLLPVTGNKTPLINVFFSICLALMVTSLLETVLITNILYSSSQYSEVPHWIRVLVLHYLARLVCLPGTPTKTKRVTVSLNPSTQAVPAVISLDGETDSCAKPAPLQDQAILEMLQRLSRDLKAIRCHVDKHFRSNRTAEEWTQISHIIDRLLFSIYITFICISIIVITIIWANWSNP
ncbi:5-hydroxytryptamine receptor 3C [Amia ocellicauda]|uniref:5-hydroxytryptamine receptor 3C n=1 Tax=Amia ocellicauda TaxID=2972642 RepID=UPI0034643F28